MIPRSCLFALLLGATCADSRGLAQTDGDLRALGIRKLPGKHVVVYTDLPSSAAIDELPRVFDAAVPLLEKYFELGPKKLDDWKVKAMVMKSGDVFRRVGLFPETLPRFLHGFARGRELWAYDQPSDYYRRHLLLHEGVHALMAEYLGGTGPPWYAEGMAELLATHSWKDGKLTLKYFPASRDEAPEWGRVKVLRDAVAAKQIPTLDEIFNYDRTAHLVVPPYAWSWAAVTFLESHPKFAKDFANLRQKTTQDDPKFNSEFRTVLDADWRLLSHEWQSFVSEADYGCVVDRAYLHSLPRRSVDSQGIKWTLKADQGWQSTGAQIEAGSTYEIQIAGRYTVRAEPKKWQSEPPGITVQYHRGRPLGMAIGAVLDEGSLPQSISPFLSGAPIGTGLEFTAKNSGVLWLRINEPASGLSDNQGELAVEIRKK